jgi:hypothetical protein
MLELRTWSIEPHMKTDLGRGFEELLNESDQRRRGYHFEKWLREVLLRGGFEVHPNPRMAMPRQTDIHSKRDGKDSLNEAKFRRSPIDVADIDALRSRLKRTPHEITACQLFKVTA